MCECEEQLWPRSKHENSSEATCTTGRMSEQNVIFQLNLL